MDRQTRNEMLHELIEDLFITEVYPKNEFLAETKEDDYDDDI